MSFSKAKIQRFNELENDVPAPGSYDPKLNSKVKGGLAMEKIERFHDNKGIGNAENNLSMCNKVTSNASTSFRTPHLLRKKHEQAPRTMSAFKPRALSAHNIVEKCDSQHEFTEFQIEYLEKDRTIHELEKHIESMKAQIQILETQLEDICKKHSDVEEQHRKDIETMVKLQQEVLSGYDEKHQTEIENFRRQLQTVLVEKDREKEARKSTEDELRSQTAEFVKKVMNMESELASKKYTNVEKIQSLEKQIEESVTKLEKETENYKHEINLLEQEKSKLSSCVDNLTDERDKLELELQKQQNEILKLQANLSTLQCELEELKAEYEKLVQDSLKEVEGLRQKYQEDIGELRNHFEKEKEIILNEKDNEISHGKEVESKVKDIEKENKFLNEELENLQRLYKNVNNRLLEAHQELEESNKKHELVLKKQKEDLADIIKNNDEEIFKLKQLLEETRLMYLKEIENLTMSSDREIAEIEQASIKKIEEQTERIKQADKRIENMEAITRNTLAACRAECEEKVKRVMAKNDAKASIMIKEAKNIVIEEMRVTAEGYKACLALMEMEQSTLNNKLTHKDAEINRLSFILQELKSAADTQNDSFGQCLEMELHKTETELTVKMGELKLLKSHVQAETAKMMDRKKRFEVATMENQASVIALTKHLTQRNPEMEELQEEFKCDDYINEHRNLLNIMLNNSQMVHEQALVLVEELDTKKELVDQLKVESLSEVESLKSIFKVKIDDLKQKTTKEIAKLTADCDQKMTKNVEMKNQLQQMASHFADTQKMLLKLKEKNEAQELEISRIQLLNEKLSELQKEHEAATEGSNKRLEIQSKKHEIALNEANSKIRELCDTIKSLEENYTQSNTEVFEEERSKWEALEEELMAKLEEERARREAAEEEVKIAAEHNERLVKEYQEISEKYAEVVGHHNHRQRIKHVSQLKDKINQLEQDLHAKNRMIEHQQKIIEKLRTEERRTHSKGKENMLGNMKNSHTMPISSPHKSLTPLRNRNEYS